MKDIELLKQLSLAQGVPGREHRVRNLVRQEIEGVFDTVTIDPLGSLIAVRKPRLAKGKRPPRQPKRIMLAAHMDQIGFLVSHVSKEGRAYIVPVGGFDARNLFARIVTVCPDPENSARDLKAVLNPATKPIHIANEDERKKIPDLSEFTLDFGIPAKEVQKRVKIGDMVVLDAPVHILGDHVVGQAMDNRVACWIAIETCRKLRTHACEIHCVFTVQEEVGLRGAIASSYTVNPDIGIGIDTTLAVDTPGVADQDQCSRLGDGAVISVADSSFIGDFDLVEQFEKLSKKHKIPAYRSILRRGGTDTGGIQRMAGGCKALTLSCPTRYIHTVTEMISVVDLRACRDLLTAYLAQAK
jgi:putative aminopeptidase FrvX